MAKRRMTPRKEQALMTRQRIFETAIELFDKRGYEKVSINDICRKAGVSTGAFYHHFKSKDQILMEEFKKVDDFYLELAEEVYAVQDYEEKLKRFNSSVMGMLAGLGLKRLKVTYHTQIGPNKKASYLGNEKRTVYSVLEELYREGQERGQLRPDISLEDLVQLTIHCYRGIIYDWCLANGSFDLAKASETMTDALLHGILSTRGSRR